MLNVRSSALYVLNCDSCFFLIAKLFLINNLFINENCSW